jgi:ribonucleoside-triphosphate reductase
LKVIKRDCTVVDFDKTKIYTAIMKAMKNGSGLIKEDIAKQIAIEIENDCSKLPEEIDISTIEAMVFKKLVEKGQELTAKAYEGYRSVREFQRENENTIDAEISDLLSGDSEYWNTENSNKNEKLVTTQRDYMAGIVCKDMTRRYLLPPEIVQAHDTGILHFHDMDYFGQKALTNCELINLEDMLQNGTVVNEVMIEKPHRLITAATIATQIITAVTSSTYGGATITLTHLAPFVRDSYNIYVEKYRRRGFTEDLVEKYAKEDLKKEIEDSVQTFNYQVNSMTNTNGQAPFLSVCMYLNETTEYKEELALLIEEFLRQRIKGLKNEVGVYITPAFPKLLYVLEEDNIRENSEYWYLTKLAAECTAKRMVPDYISEKIMKKNKIDANGNGNCFPCMGKRKLQPRINRLNLA